VLLLVGWEVDGWIIEWKKDLKGNSDCDLFKNMSDSATIFCEEQNICAILKFNSDGSRSFFDIFRARGHSSAALYDNALKI
jgi:hypothetical protein